MSETTHAKIQAYAKLSERSAQDEAGLILVETPHPIEEALKAGLVAEAIFSLSYKSFDFPTTVIDERTMKKLSTTDSLPPCIGIFKKPTHSLADLFANPNLFLLVLDGLQDAGNVGTLIRSAVAFGVTGILLTKDTVNPFHPKVIRGSAGLVFHQPVLAVNENLATLIPQLGVNIMLATNRAPQLRSYKEADYRQPLALVLGREGPGLPEEVVSNPQYQAVNIPMPGDIDSLNVAISGSIILAEAASQRA